MNLTDPDTFERVYRDHSRTVFHAALRITKDPQLADDVMHDVFVRLWRRPSRFDPARGDLAAYLRMMARSRALDLWREAQAAGRAQGRLEQGFARDQAGESGDGPLAQAVADERAVAVREALGELPEPQREALVLAYWGGLTTEEVARRVGVPLGTAKSRIRLGLAKLRTTAGDLARSPELA